MRYAQGRSLFRNLFSYLLFDGQQSQEACFNLGRAFHHLKINHLALSFYQRVFDINEQDQGQVCNLIIGKSCPASIACSLVEFVPGRTVQQARPGDTAADCH